MYEFIIYICNRNALKSKRKKNQMKKKKKKLKKKTQLNDDETEAKIINEMK